MSKNLITEEKLDADIRSLSAKVRNFRTKFSKTIDKPDIATRLDAVLKRYDYDYKLNKEEEKFIVKVSPNFNIYGYIEKSVIKMGVYVSYNGIETVSRLARAGMIDIPGDELELYLPVFDKLIEEGKALIAGLDEQQKKDKSAELLESILHNQLEKAGITDFEISSDGKDGYRLSKNLCKLFVRSSLDFSNYEQRCSDWIKALSRFPADFPVADNVMIIQPKDSIVFKYKDGLEEDTSFDADYNGAVMRYPESLSARTDQSDGAGVVTPLIEKTLKRLSFKYYIDESSTLCVYVTEEILLCLNPGAVFFRVETPDFKKDLPGTALAETEIVAMLEMMAYASSKGRLTFSPLDFVGINKQNFHEYWNDFIRLVLPSDFISDGVYDGYFICIGLQYTIRIAHNGPTMSVLRYIVDNIDKLRRLPDLWRDEPEGSHIQVLMSDGPYFDFKSLWKDKVGGKWMHLVER